MNFFSSMRNKTTVAVFDIGSGTVGGALVTLHGKEIPTIHNSTRETISFEGETSSERRLQALMRALERVITKVQRKSAIDDVHVVLGVPWYQSQTHLIRLNQTKEFTVSHSFFDEVIGEAKKKLSSKKTVEGMPDDTLVRVEETVIQTSLNGYPTNDPYGKKANRFEAAVYLSAAPNVLVSRIRDLMEHSFHTENISFHSFLLSAYLASRDHFEDLNDYMLVDVSGESTEIGLVRGDVLIESVSIAWGRNDVIRELADRIGTIPQEAETMLHMTTGKGTEIKNERAETALREVSVKYGEMSSKALGELSKEERLPDTLLLVTQADTAQWFESVLSGEVNKKFTLTNTSFNIRKLDAKEMAKSVSLTKDVRPDPFLALESISLSKMLFTK